MLRLPPELQSHLAGGGTLLVPSAAQARAVERAYARTALAAGAEVWRTPVVCTPAAWQRRELERRAQEEPSAWPRLLSAAEEWRLWRASVLDAAAGLELLDTAALASALQRSRALALGYGLTPAAGRAGSEEGLLRAVETGFRERCEAQAASTALDLAGRLGPAPRVAHAGFTVLPPWVRAHAVALEPTGACEEPAALVRPADPVAELEAMCAWCVQQLGNDPAAQLLLVLPGSAGRRERLVALLRQALDATGLDGEHPERTTAVLPEEAAPLAQQSLPAHALHALELLGGERAGFEAWAGFLNSPQWSLPPVARAALVQWLRATRVAALDLRELRARLGVVPRELRAVARELDARLRGAAAQLGGARATPRQWAERWQGALAQLTWPGALSQDELGQRQLRAWHALLEEFESLGRSAPALQRTEALQLLKELAARAPFDPPAGMPSITVSAHFADPIATYDGIWVAGVSAQALPLPLAPDPFLPRAAQCAAGVAQASPAGRSAEATALLARWRLAASGALVYSVPQHAEDLELSVSPLLRGLGVRAVARQGWLGQALHRPDWCEPFTDMRGTPWHAREVGGTRALALQNQCPFRAYAELRLGDEERWGADPGIGQDLRGRLLHKALEFLWEALRDSQGLQARAPPALAALIGHCVADAAQQVHAQQLAPRHARGARGQYDLFQRLPPAYLRECTRAQRLILKLCELERTRARFSVLALEAPRELNLGGGQLRLRPDRIDRGADGALLVLDYKTGVRTRADWLAARPTHPQLIAYAVALGTEVAALATVDLRPREITYSGIAARADLLPGVAALAVPPGEDAGAAWATQHARWRECLAGLIGAYLAGDARLDPLPGACRRCHVIDLCRVRELGTAEAADDEDEDD